MFLEIDPISNTVELSKAVSEQGISNVLSGLMILTFIVMGGFLLKIIYNAISKITETLSNINNNNKELLTQNANVINGLSELLNKRKEENLLLQTKCNTERLLKKSFNDNIVDLMNGTIDILDKNHIDDKDFTQRRVSSLVNSSHFDRIRWLNNFTYEMDGSVIRIGELIDNEDWINIIIDIILMFIHSADKDKDGLFRDLQLAYKNFNNELKL